MGSDRAFWSLGDGASLSTTLASVQLGAAFTDAGDETLPDAGFLDRLEIDLSDVAGDPTEIQIFLTHDAAGKQFVSPGGTDATRSLTTSPAGNTFAGTAFSLGHTPWRKIDGLYAWLSLDAGTATATVRVVGTTAEPWAGAT